MSGRELDEGKVEAQSLARGFVAALAFATVIAIASAAAAGRSLGLFFGPVLLITLVSPYLQQDWVARASTLARVDRAKPRARVLARATQILAVLAGLNLPVLLMWAAFSRVEIATVVICAMVLGAWILTLLGLPMLLRRLGFPSITACAIVVVLAFAWLTWPVWLSRELPTDWGQWIVRWLAPTNPLLAINGVLRVRFDMWDRYRIAYQQLTTLNQDVIYTLPRSIWPSVLVNAVIGLAGLVVRDSRVQVPPVSSPAVPSVPKKSAGEDTGGTV